MARARETNRFATASFVHRPRNDGAKIRKREQGTAAECEEGNAVARGRILMVEVF